ncbi:DegT/DnrJ/EryC1/StrS family aminotransferase [Methyloglobulus sp.]|uniref:DegT/DnrJ/EryC1/StrS family aminotransferase n=1 Tax=Methyloglobulus sp. TaxID=2518622 RepID=UPI0032B7AF93
MKIDFANLQYQYQLYKNEIDSAIHAVLNKSNYILGEECDLLERELETFTEAKHAIVCSSGTDALLLAMMALDIQPGDEVITTPFTFIATAETIALMKATPVFVDIQADTYNIDPSKIEAAITPKTKAIIPVSLYGQPADMDEIKALADKHELKVIIDGAQSFGATYQGKSDSALGDISCTSFFPAKPLGCYGDGGAVFTSDDGLAEKMRMLRVHGQGQRYHHKYIGIGGRLDTLQAAVLLAKIKHYKKEIQLRQRVAQSYNHKLSNSVELTLPEIKTDRTSVWAQYTLRTPYRNALQEKLQKVGIPTAVHYPKPLHLQECFEYLNYKEGDFQIAETAAQEVISLPMNPFLMESEADFIAGNLSGAK